MLKTEEKKVLAGELQVLACGPGCRALYVTKEALVHIGAAGPGFPMQRFILPLPPGGGRVVAGSAVDISVVCADGSLWCWQHVSGTWECVGNPREGA